MKPAPFAYVRPATVDEALACLASAPGDARPLAGGQSLVPLLNMRLARPATLVDLNALADLGRIDAAPDGGLALGALVRHADLAGSALVRERAPLLAAAAAHIGHRAIRHRGTLGGSLAHADPAAELPAAVVALGGRLLLRRRGGEREIDTADFFRGLFTTALEPDELLTAITFPARPRGGWAIAEMARRPGDFALAGVCGLLERDGVRGVCVRARLVAFGVADRPLRLVEAEACVTGRPIDAGSAGAAGRAAASAADPPDDVHASAAYRRHLVAVLTEQVIRNAMSRAEEEA